MSDETIFIEDDDDDFIRPFLVTGGRTRSNFSNLQMETMVQASGGSHSLRFESAQVVNICQRGPLSVAEVSAHLRIPLGTTKVLIGDLIEQGFLQTFDTVSSVENADISLIHRLAAGVRAL